MERNQLKNIPPDIELLKSLEILILNNNLI